jgi:serine/threonine protein kinase
MVKKKAKVQKKKKAPLRKTVPPKKPRLRAPPGGLRNPFERKVPRFLTSTQLKNYRIVKRIGAGSFGNVYKAVSPKKKKKREKKRSNKDVAVKLVDLKDTSFDEFQREYGVTSFLGKNHQLTIDKINVFSSKRRWTEDYRGLAHKKWWEQRGGHCFRLVGHHSR